mmetsp:Transcript_12222/g.20427  ORF Transcript_12222/g.20427 Transcript_12222/m.20427 type:complete len:292 (-) Transcript_12222:297-1172(-)
MKIFSSWRVTVFVILAVVVLQVFQGVTGQDAEDAAESLTPSILLESALRGDVDGIHRAMEAQEDIDVSNDNGWTAARFAVDVGNIEMLLALVNAGADLNVADRQGYTPLMMAADDNDLEMVQALLSSNANPLLAANNGDTAYSLSVSAGRRRVTMMIAEACAAHAMEQNDMTALLQSIERGAYVNYHNQAGWTPLIYATAMNNVDAVNTMLRYGADLDRSENDGWTALHFAAELNQAELTQLLLERGANPYLRASAGGGSRVMDGPTAREIAIERNFPEIVDLIPAPKDDL